MKKNEMEIVFDLDCMKDDARRKMEHRLLALLKVYGWTSWASGAEMIVSEEGARKRDVALMHCPDTNCEHYDDHFGCNAKVCNKR